MSGGSGVIAGPEVDMTELDAVSSAPLAVDLNLNLGPAFALELALGGQDFSGSLPVSRPNWPRFEPGILAGGQDDDGPAMAEDPNLVLPDDQHGTASDARSFHAHIDRSAVRGATARERVVRDDGEGSLRGLLQTFRNTRHMRHPRRPRQVVFAPIPDLVQQQDSSEHGSTTESRALAVGDSALSIIPPRDGNERTPNTFLEITPMCEANQEASKEESSEVANKTEAGPVGAHFECNICLEMASEPVVTCCGHLFCWPCLHRWLHLHSSQKECPVCKGFLSDAVITPIYGRGSSEDTDKVDGNTPPRPHAHRINGKRRWQDRLDFGRQDGGASVGGGSSEVQTDSNQPEASSATELVLNRLRVAQRLQREYVDRLRLRQRLIVRRAVFRPPSAMGASAFSPSGQSPEQNANNNLLTRVARHGLETADSLAAIGASMDGLRENLEHMQRTLEIASALPAQDNVSSVGEGVNAGSSAQHTVPVPEERVPPPLEAETLSPGHSTNAEVHVETPELPQASRRALQRALSEASGSFDAEPGSLHARKRRRLN